MKRIMTLLITFAVAHLSLCMEQDPKKQDSADDSAKALSIVPVAQTASFWEAIPTFGSVSDYMSNGWMRATRTVGNFAFDSEAFRMLGWPPEDPGAQEELAKALS